MTQSHVPSGQRGACPSAAGSGIRIRGGHPLPLEGASPWFRGRPKPPDTEKPTRSAKLSQEIHLRGLGRQDAKRAPAARGEEQVRSAADARAVGQPGYWRAEGPGWALRGPTLPAAPCVPSARCRPSQGRSRSTGPRSTRRGRHLLVLAAVHFNYVSRKTTTHGRDNAAERVSWFL